MSAFKVHTLETAPSESTEKLLDSIKEFGMLPNLHGVLAESPQTLETYKFIHQQFQKTSLDAEELTVIWLSINVEHECHYCVPAHTGIAHSMKVNPEFIEALRNEETLSDQKLQTLRDTTLSMIRNRGRIPESELNSFYDAGYENQQLMEIALGIAQKTISNYINYLAQTPVDKAFKKFEWSKKQ